MGIGVYLMIIVHSYMFSRNETNYRINFSYFISFAIGAYFIIKIFGIFYLFAAMMFIIMREMGKQTSNILSIFLHIIIVIISGGLWFI